MRSLYISNLGWTLWSHIFYIHQHLYESLFGTCTMLCNVVQPLKGKKLQTQPAMSKFWQAGTSSSCQGRPGSLHVIGIIQSTFLYFPNMAREPEQSFICWCLSPSLLSMTMTILHLRCIGQPKNFMGWDPYSICPLAPAASKKSSVGFYRPLWS
jgi:hypothetical protein